MHEKVCVWESMKRGVSSDDPCEQQPRASVPRSRGRPCRGSAAWGTQPKATRHVNHAPGPACGSPAVPGGLRLFWTEAPLRADQIFGVLSLLDPVGSDSVGLREESKACILKTPQEMARDGPRTAVWACTVCASRGEKPGTPGSGDALGVVPWAASLAPALQSGTPSSTIPSCRATGNGAPKPRHQYRRVCLSNERSSAPVLMGSPCPAPSFLSMWPWSSWSQDGCRPSCPQDRGGRGSVQLERDTVPDRLPPESLWPESLAQPISCGRGWERDWPAAPNNTPALF